MTLVSEGELLKLIQRNDLEGLKTFISGYRRDESMLCNEEPTLPFQLLSAPLTKAGDSALHISANLGYFNVLRYLIEDCRANIEISNLDGKTPLHFASHSSQLNVVEYLLDQGANVNALKKADWTPLMLACTKDNVDIVEHLLRAGANPTFRNKDGWNSLHIASRHGNLNIVKCLLSSQTNCKDADKMILCQAKSKNGRIPLHTAVMHGHTEIVEYLLHQCRDFEGYMCCRDSCGTIPIMEACRFGFLDILEKLVDVCQSQLYLTNSNGMNCLHIASEAGQNSVIEILIAKYGMNVDGVTDTGFTALHYAARENQLETVNLLLKHGATTNIENKYGHTCIDLAQRLRKNDVLKLLQS